MPETETMQEFGAPEHMQADWAQDFGEIVTKGMACLTGEGAVLDNAGQFALQVARVPFRSGGVFRFGEHSAPFGGERTAKSQTGSG